MLILFRSVYLWCISPLRGTSSDFVPFGLIEERVLIIDLQMCSVNLCTFNSRPLQNNNAK